MVSKQAELQYFSQLDGFRFFAIASVMLSHFITTGFVTRFPFGYGVMLFFVLSSFLITRILLNAKQINEGNSQSNWHSFKQFYIRRSLRIFPIYYLLIFFFFLLNLSPCRIIFPWLISYTVNFFIGYSGDASIAGSFTHLWSLAIEEQFYLVFPFFIFFIRQKYILRFLIGLTVLGLIGRMFLYVTNPLNVGLWNFHTISALDSLGIGGILGYLSFYRVATLKKIIGNKVLFLLVILAFLSVMVFGFSIYDNDMKYNIYSAVLMRFLFNISCFWILGWSITFGYNNIIKLILENKLITYLGKISYGLYLYHFFVLNIGNLCLNRLKLSFSEEINAIIFTIVSIMFASLSWYIIEKPINKLKRNFSYSN